MIRRATRATTKGETEANDTYVYICMCNVQNLRWFHCIHRKKEKKREKKDLKMRLLRLQVELHELQVAKLKRELE